MSPFVTGFFHSAYVFKVHPGRRIRIASLFWLKNIPLYGYIIFCLSIYPLMDIWVVSTCWLLWVMVQWTFTYKFLCGCMFSVPLGMGLGVELLGHMVTFWRSAELSSKTAPLTFPAAVYRALISPHPHQHLLLSVFLVIYTHSSGYKVVSHYGFDLHFPSD